MKFWNTMQIILNAALIICNATLVVLLSISIARDIRDRKRRKHLQEAWDRISKDIAVKVTWDAKAKVWTAESSDIPGLALESDSITALAEELRSAVPELLALNRR